MGVARGGAGGVPAPASTSPEDVGQLLNPEGLVDEEYPPDARNRMRFDAGTDQHFPVDSATGSWGRSRPT